VANPAGPGQDNVAALLRRVAETIDKFDLIEVRDVVFGTEITADGPWHSITVYFDREDE